jgi:hypothetical protein
MVEATPFEKRRTTNAPRISLQSVSVIGRPIFFDLSIDVYECPTIKEGFALKKYPDLTPQDCYQVSFCVYIVIQEKDPGHSFRLVDESGVERESFYTGFTSSLGLDDLIEEAVEVSVTAPSTHWDTEEIRVDFSELESFRGAAKSLGDSVFCLLNGRLLARAARETRLRGFAKSLDGVPYEVHKRS